MTLDNTKPKQKENKMNNEIHWSKFKRQWIDDAMRWGHMTKAEALNYWEQQEYKDE